MPGLDSPAALPALFAPVAGEGAIGLAVSGGGDSLALMLLAKAWVEGLVHPPRLFVYSVDHGLRPEAAAEVAFVLRAAAQLGMAARALRWDGAKPANGLQAAARAARYRLMGEVMRADGATVLLTAHHRDDQAETVLMRLAHGSGLEGLRGMDALSTVEGVPVFRPLLGVAPATLAAIVAGAGLTPVADPSNTDRHYERVRWRQALPPLAALGLDAERLAQFARRAGEADAALAAIAAERFSALVTLDPLGAAQLPLAALLMQPRAVGVKMLARLLDLVGGGQKPRALGAVERLHDRLADGGFTAVTSLGVRVRRQGATLWLSREAGRRPLPRAAVPPAATLAWDGRFRIANRSGESLSVGMAGALSRHAAERLVGRRLGAPAAAIQAAPLVAGADGRPLALGRYCFSAAVEVEFSEEFAGLGIETPN